MFGRDFNSSTLPKKKIVIFNIEMNLMMTAAAATWRMLVGEEGDEHWAEHVWSPHEIDVEPRHDLSDSTLHRASNWWSMIEMIFSIFLFVWFNDPQLVRAERENLNRN